MLIIVGALLPMRLTSTAQSTQSMSPDKSVDNPKLYREETVQFKNGETTLSGVLCLPTTNQAPYPAIVFIVGSGPAERNGYSYSPPLWQEFASRGFASLAWDKPGVGESTGDWKTQTTEDRAHEGLSAVEFLKQRTDIDSQKIGLWGISQAGWVMPLMISTSKDIAFMISVSAPVGTGAQQEIYRVAHQLLADGISPKDTERALAFTELRFGLMRLNAPYKTYVHAQKLVENEPWLGQIGRFSELEYNFIQSRTDFSAQSYLEKVTCPVLAIFGERDMIVDVSQSVEIYPVALAKAGNKHVTVRVFPNADHCIFLSQTGGMEEMGRGFQQSVKPFAPGYLQLMGEWLEKTSNSVL